MSISISVVVADDHRIVLEGLRNYLQGQSGIDVVGDASDGRTAIELVRRRKPDVALLDVTMAELNGVDATREILRHAPETKVCALTMHTSREFVADMIRAGASGYVVKSAPFDDVITAVRRIAKGGVFFSPEVADAADEALRGKLSLPPGAMDELTDIDRQVLQLVSEGKSSKEIAQVLHVTKKTVDYHRQSVMNKLNIHTVAELTKFAIRQGMTPLDSPLPVPRVPSGQ